MKNLFVNLFIYILGANRYQISHICDTNSDISDANYTNWAVDNYIPSVYNLRQQNTR
nr:MAG TPA: hypothetical protein [Caudoviricetes sp.]DAL62822.1 MAG TPA_asm: hypothetical protein [Caudoviricetes sp.]